MSKEIANKIPTLQELYKKPELELKKELFNHYINQNPPAKWVVTHPFIKNYNYLPIDKVEFLLRKFYKDYRIEVLKTGLLLNTVEVTVRVHFINPVTGEWSYHDGVGAKEIQTNKGTGALKLEMSNISNGAIQMALPIAKTVAIKDACDHLGNIFGANLNRKDTLEFTIDNNLKEYVYSKEEERMIKLIEQANDKATLESLKTHVTEKLQQQFDLKWKQINLE